MEVQVGAQGQAPGPAESLLGALGPVVPERRSRPRPARPRRPRPPLPPRAAVDRRPASLSSPAGSGGDGAGRPTSTRTSSPRSCPRRRRCVPRMSSGRGRGHGLQRLADPVGQPAQRLPGLVPLPPQVVHLGLHVGQPGRGRGREPRSRSRAASASSRSRSAAASRSSSAASCRACSRCAGGLGAQPARLLLQLVGGHDRHLLDLVGLAQPGVGLGPRLGERSARPPAPRPRSGRAASSAASWSISCTRSDTGKTSAPARRVGQQPAGDLELGRAVAEPDEQVVDLAAQRAPAPPRPRPRSCRPGAGRSRSPGSGTPAGAPAARPGRR